MFQNHLFIWILAILLGVLALVALVASTAGAEDREITPINLWLGSVDDVSVQGLGAECIGSQKGLEELWRIWRIAEPLPLIDFDREIALVITGNGSVLYFESISLSNDGNLVMSHVETLDLVPGFRYAIGTVKRAGVKTVNGHEVPANHVHIVSAPGPR